MRADARPRQNTPTRICSAVLALVVTSGAGVAQAQAAAPASANGIYSCTLPDGRKLTSDRPIAECRGVEQRVLNRDGSLRRVVPPTPTAEELAAQEAEQRRIAQQRQAQLDAIRRDRNLKTRYPDEATHQRAREAALDPVLVAIQSTEKRLDDLQRERGPLMAETEFYQGRPLPDPLRHQLEANEAAADAQRDAMRSHRAELDRINRIYDAELDRLRKLWAGAAPGSIGPTPSTTVPVAAELRNGKNETPR
jgi:hypothetical protein